MAETLKVWSRPPDRGAPAPPATIVDASRRRQLRSATLVAALTVAGVITVCLAGCKPTALPSSTAESDLLREQQIARLKMFSAEKEEQSRALAAAAGETISTEFQRYFAAARSGDWQTVTNRFEHFQRHRPNNLARAADVGLGDSFWQPAIEIAAAYETVVDFEPKYTQLLIDGILPSIPPGSIYFGGTDEGRGLPTAFCKSHVDADPFFTLTQNQLADTNYLAYLRSMYGKQINLPSAEDRSMCFSNYLRDAGLRLQHDTDFPNEPKQLKRNENVKFVKEGNRQRVQVSGRVAVMAINELLLKVIFDKNPDREFYLEESQFGFPFGRIYPHLSPHGLIFKINRDPLPELPEDIVRRDHDYWSNCVQPIVGDWITYDTPVQQVAAFVEKVYLQHDLRGFSGDPRFIHNVDAQGNLSYLRVSIAGVYAWRVAHAAGESEKALLTREADFAFRQAWVLCPNLSEAVSRYVDFLKTQDRIADAILIAETAARFPSSRGIDTVKFRDLTAQLKQLQRTK
jgi:hypothetical protein